MQPIIKWTGSKRYVVGELNKLKPTNFDGYYEPFVGGGSFSYFNADHRCFCSDTNKHLIGMWKIIQEEPDFLFYTYGQYWQNFKRIGKDYYFEIRKQFNQDSDPYKFFFLTRTSVNGLIRFNKKGEFNASCGYGRNGIQPKTLKPILEDWHSKVKNFEYSNVSYKDITPTSKDFVFCDPPYEGRNEMYQGEFNYSEFENWLEVLNEKNIKWMVTTRSVLTPELSVRVLTTSGGNSSFRQLAHNDIQTVKEYIYLNY